jgi:hypothetical protein
MLGFSFSSLAVHKKPKIKTRPLLNPPQIDASGMPIVQNISVSRIGDTTADISWWLVSSEGGFTISTVECYRVSESQQLDPYDASLRDFSYDVRAETGQITITANSLTQNTEYRVRVMASKYSDIGAIDHYTQWSYYLETFFTQSIPFGFSGFRNNVWYREGVLTGLPASGTGVYDGDYYIQGNVTGFRYLPGLGWSGNWLGYIYIGGNLANGRYFCPMCSSEDLWFINGVPIQNFYFLNGIAADYGTISAMGGTGDFGGVYYSNYQRYTGNVDGVYYSYGQSTTLDSSGTGYIGGNGIPETYHVNGAKYTGWLDGDNIYFIDGKATTLGPDGTGVINGKYYYAGMYIGEVANPYSYQQNSNQASRFSSGITYA